jgi:hypothetical protein
VRPEFVVFSFYKMLGHPTGLGALLVRTRIGSLLAATYFGGGTVDMHLGNVVPWLLFHCNLLTIQFISLGSLEKRKIWLKGPSPQSRFAQHWYE